MAPKDGTCARRSVGPAAETASRGCNRAPAQRVSGSGLALAGAGCATERDSTCRSADCNSSSGKVVEYIVAIGVIRARFLADAFFLAFARAFPFSWHHVEAGARALPVPRSRGTLPRMHPRGRSDAPWRVSGSLQGLYSAKGADLAGSLPGISSGWQQSKQDWGLPAVMEERV